MTATGVRLDHLDAMTDERGLFEHACGSVPRREHGYCTDDNARLLVVATREDDAGPAGRLARTALAFTLAAEARDGRFRNRMDTSGRWLDQPGTDDCWGRATWGLGVAAAAHTDPSVRDAARKGFDVAVRQRSWWPRSMAFAALGAAEVLTVDPSHDDARELLRRAVTVIGTPARPAWVWPEARLAYANAALAEALIAAGSALERPEVRERGLGMLAWLLDEETATGHLSVTGVGGRDARDGRPQFDQQPIEAAAMADACWRASVGSTDARWAAGLHACVAWFAGDNDGRVQMWDDVTGGGFDGLTAGGANINQGAESTLAFVSTMQRARSLASVP